MFQSNLKKNNMISCFKIFIMSFSKQSPPYGMLKDSAQQLTGNDRFEGIGIDLIHELSLMLGFNYTFQLQEDGVYGSINNVTKEWSGMIRELIDEVSKRKAFLTLEVWPIEKYNNINFRERIWQLLI